MKSLLVTTAFLFICGLLFSQKAFPFKDAQLHGVEISELDSLYKSAIHSDSTLAVFQDQEAVMKAYTQLLQDFGTFLYKHDFIWDHNVNSFNRIYFAPNGRIDYFIYTFRMELSDDQAKRFDELLNQFIAKYRFPLKAKVKFAQCSPVTYTPMSDEDSKK